MVVPASGHMPEAKRFAKDSCQVAFESHELTLLAGGVSCPFIALLPGRQDLLMEF